MHWTVPVNQVAEFDDNILVKNIMAYGSMPYVGMTPKEKEATLKVHKRHAQNVCYSQRPHQVLSSASMSNKTVNLESLKYQTSKS